MYGGGFDAAHVALNRGKRSVALDLRHADVAPVLERLMGWAHVVVESHRPGQLDRFGLGYQAMTAGHAHGVWCSITGFGDVGPNAEQPGQPPALGADTDAVPGEAGFGDDEVADPRAAAVVA